MPKVKIALAASAVAVGAMTFGLTAFDGARDVTVSRAWSLEDSTSAPKPRKKRITCHSCHAGEERECWWRPDSPEEIEALFGDKYTFERWSSTL